MKIALRALLASIGCSLVVGAAGAVTLGQIDDFEGGDTAGWTKGANTTNPPTNVPTGGPSGANDNYLQTVATGGAGSDSRLAVLNASQWTGDYAGAGVTDIAVQFRNTSDSTLHMRIALEGSGGLSWFVSSTAVQVPPDGAWHAASFGLAETDLTRVMGAQTYAAALASVTEFRFISSQSGTSFRGDVVVATLGLDNIAALADSDGDGVPDGDDAFPNDPTEWQDSDGDGVGDNADAFPDDAAETTDTDGDGTGDNADPDDDNDGVPDVLDDYPLGRFDDARPGYWAFSFIEALARAGITGGCGGANYCPESPVTRAQMAVFLERGINGSGFVPPPATGNVFLDVAAGAFAAGFIERLAADGVTGGCGGNNYCPGSPVTRAQMAVFLLRAMHGSSYVPPPPSGAVFGDVSSAYWAVAWIEQLAAEGITGGCGNGDYCPEASVNRAQMAVFLVRAFGL